MAYRRVLDVDPLTGARIVYHHEEGKRGNPDRIVLDTQCDVQALIDANQAEYNANDHSSRKFWKTDMRKIASISKAQCIDLEKQGIMTQAYKILDQKKLMRWLHDPANQKWRTMPGNFLGAKGATGVNE